MSMNREQRRMMQRQGEVDADGEPIRTRRESSQQRTKEERTGPLQFFRECRAELRKVAWSPGFLDAVLFLPGFLRDTLQPHDYFAVSSARGAVPFDRNFVNGAIRLRCSPGDFRSLPISTSGNSQPC